MLAIVREIKAAVLQLTPEQLTVFRTWFAEYDAPRWDEQFASDVAAGRLDALADEDLRDGQKANHPL